MSGDYRDLMPTVDDYLQQKHTVPKLQARIRELEAEVERLKAGCFMFGEMLQEKSNAIERLVQAGDALGETYGWVYPVSVVANWNAAKNGEGGETDNSKGANQGLG